AVRLRGRPNHAQRSTGQAHRQRDGRTDPVHRGCRRPVPRVHLDGRVLMALVYRVEHAVLGGGPYRPYGQDHDRGEEFWPEGADEELRRFSDALCDAHGWYEGDADGVLRPTGSRDGLRVTAGRIYGCPSVATLRRWFNRYGSALEENGFVVTLYAVPEA